MEQRLEKRNKLIKIIAVVSICFLDVMPVAWLLSYWTEKNIAISVKNASANLPDIIGQNLAVTSVSILLLVITAFILRKNFVADMYLGVKTKKQRILVIILGVVLLVMVGILLVTKEDKVTVLYNLFYYLFFVAFFEEFVVRGVCVHILKDFSAAYRYLVPNLCFAMMHIFVTYGFGELTIAQVLRFLVSSLSGYVILGCLFQLLKEKSGTLWVPILLHAIMDFSSVFGS